MTGLRWDRDSPGEDDQARRATEIDQLTEWAWQQQRRPLTDALEAAGYTYDHREGWAAWIVPSWWPMVDPPEPRCSWCQAPDAADPCPACQLASGGDPPSLLDHWRRLPAQARRLHLAARYHLDPWSGRPVTIEMEWTEAVQPGEPDLATCRYPLHTVTPACRWDAEGAGD